MKKLLLLFIPLVFFFGCQNDDDNASCNLNNNWQLDYIYYVISGENVGPLINYEYYFCAEDYTNLDFDCYDSTNGGLNLTTIVSDISFYDYVQNQGGSIHLNIETTNEKGELGVDFDYDGTWIISDCEEGGEITIIWNEPITLNETTVSISYLYILELTENNLVLDFTDFFIELNAEGDVTLENAWMHYSL